VMAIAVATPWSRCWSSLPALISLTVEYRCGAGAPSRHGR
jgi:hypothetical protein